MYIPPGQVPVFVPMQPAAPAVPPAPAPAPAADDGSNDVTKLPQWAQRELAATRAEAAKHRVQARAALVTQHVQLAAGQLGADPARLLGSVMFVQQAEQLDPAAPDFAARLTYAIQQTLVAQPWVSATPAAPAALPVPPVPPVPGQPVPPTPQGPPQSGGHFPAGTGAGLAITEADLVKMTPAEVQKAFDEGRLKHLM
jgi:hypothetical protein